MTQEEKIKHFEEKTGMKYDPNVKTLYCSGNGLTVLPDLPNVEYLDCSGNGLTVLPDLPNVEYLYCSGNGLTVLPALPNVKTLDCRGNEKLKGIKKETLYLSKSIGSRYEITEYWVESNEIKCGCWNGNLKEFKERIDSVYPEKENKYRIQYLKFIEECEIKKSK